MSGIGFSEFLILCVIGLIVLGPERLPKVARQIGGWVGQARRMTRALKRQLEDELDFDKELNIKPTIHSPASQSSTSQSNEPLIDHPPPHDDDTFSPLHKQPPSGAVASKVDLSGENKGGADNEDDAKNEAVAVELDVEPDYDEDGNPIEPEDDDRRET